MKLSALVYVAFLASLWSYSQTGKPATDSNSNSNPNPTKNPAVTEQAVTVSPCGSTGPYASRKSLREPELFAPGIISTGEDEADIQFSSDGRIAYFVRRTPDHGFSVVLESHYLGGNWTEPQAASFSGQYSDADPFLSPDGQHFFFVSTRPLSAGAAMSARAIWVMDRTAFGWSFPRRLDPPVNLPNAEQWSPTVANNGTLYFASSRPGANGDTNIYRARLNHGGYSQIELLSLPPLKGERFSKTSILIAPDESFLIYGAFEDRDGQPVNVLRMSRNKNTTEKGAIPIWSEPEEIRLIAPSRPKFSPDGKYFFFTSSHRADVWTALDHKLTAKDLSQMLRSPGNGLGDIYQIETTALGLNIDPEKVKVGGDSGVCELN